LHQGLGRDVCSQLGREGEYTGANGGHGHGANVILMRGPERCIQSLGQDPEFAGWVWAVVDVPVEKYLGPAEKINITVPQIILARIDEYAKRHRQSRSGFLVDAARAAMAAQP